MRLAFLIIVVYVTLIVIFLKWFFRRGLFNPDKNHIWCPGNVNYIDIMIDGINVWHFNNFPTRPTILYCHGTSGNISYQVHIVTLCQRLRFNLILFDYHGYGSSTGVATQENLFVSADKVCNYASSFGTTPLIIWGESLGGAPATYLSSKYNVDLLILLSTFSSLDALAHDKSWLVKMLGKSLPYITHPLRNAEMIQKARCPVLIIHSEEDDLINVSHAEELLNNVAHEQKDLIKIKGTHRAPHIDHTVLEKIVGHCGLELDCNCDDILEAIKNDDN